MKYQTLLYYCYSPIANAEQFAADHLTFCKSLGLVGRIIVAEEGLNGTVSGSKEACETYMTAIHADERFAKSEFKIDEVEEMLDRDDVVVLDVRSNYEHNLGKFKNAVTLDIENFRDFPDQINALAKYKDKKIMTYCTGGIKCEKASALLLHHGFTDVYQLHGGIIKYGKEAGGKDFEGKCYVFDNRIAVDVNSVNPSIVSVCYNCGKTTPKMINCANPECNEHITQCDDCGDQLQGCCSEACTTHPRKREYDGTGYYVKVPQPVAKKLA